MNAASASAPSAFVQHAIASTAIPLLPPDATWLSIAQAVGPTIVAVIVAYVAIRQWLTARNKLKLDLFEKRYDVYIAVVTYLSRLTQGVRITNEHVHEVSFAIAGCEFVFNPEMNEFVRDIMYRGGEYFSLQRKAGMVAITAEERSELEAQMDGYVARFRTELSDIAKPFRKFMNLSH